MSVNACPIDVGGFVFVGAPRCADEIERAAIFELAERAGVLWLEFDVQATVIDGPLRSVCESLRY